KASFTGTVVDPQGEPLVGIDVKMAVSRKWQYTFNPDDRNLIDIWTTSTDTSGFFFFPAASQPQADYLLQINAADYPVKQIENLKANIGFSRDLGELKLEEPSLINGQVVDAGNQAIANALIECYISFDDKHFQKVNDTITTDDQGFFTTAALPARDIFIQAQADGFVGEISPRLKLKEGQEFDALLITLSKPQFVKGKVVDINNQFIANAVVSQNQLYTHRSIENSVETDAAGHFELAVSPALDRIKLFTQADGYRTSQTTISPNGDEVLITLSPTPTISGIVRDGSQRPVANAQVVLCSRKLSTPLINRGIDLESCNGYASTDAEGRFTIIAKDLALADTQLKLIAFTDEHPPTQYNRLINVASGKKVTTKDYNDIVIELKRGFTITGIAKNESGQSVDKAQVLLRLLAKPRQSRLPSVEVRRGGSIIGEVLTDSSGNFEFTNLEDGEYRVEVYHRDYSPTQSDDVSLIDVDYNCALIMRAPGGITGQFIGDISLYPNLIVQATSPGLDLIQAKPNADGSFEFLNLMPGTYSLQAHNVLNANRGKWWQSAQTPLARADGVVVAAGNFTNVNLEIDSAGFASIVGRMQINGQPAVSYKVFAVPHIYGAAAEDQRMVVRENVMHMREARTNPDGRFEINGLVPNDYWVIVRPPESERWDMAKLKPTGLAVHEIRIGDAQQYQVNFDIRTGSVKVTPQDERNLRGRSIKLKPVPNDGRDEHSLYVSPGRSRTYDGIAEGAYEWVLSNKDSAQPVFVPASGTIEIDVTLPKRESSKLPSSPR
ncbi:MAG: hypothetical protein ACI81F_000590, partial [Thalassolituus oleivorans]